MFSKLSISGTVLTVLGILGIALDVGSQLTEVFDFMPEIVSKIVFAVSGIITTMGLREIMLSSQENIVKKVVDFKSETFWGSALAFLTPLLVDPVGVDSATLSYVMQGAGILFGVLGLGSAGKRGIWSE